MNRLVARGTLAALLVAAAAPLEARQTEPFRAGTAYGAIHAGGTAYTDFLRTVETTASSAGAGAGLRRLTARTTGTAGAAVEFAPSGHWALRVQASWAPSRFEIVEPPSPPAPNSLHAAPAATDESLLAGLHIWTADVALLFHIPVRLGSTALYGVAGAGATQYRARPAADEPLPAAAVPDFAGGSVRRAVAVLGIGARIPLQWRDSRLGFEIAGHIGAPPIGRMAEEPSAHAEQLDFASQLRFQLALSVPLFSARGLVGEPHAARPTPDP